MALRRCAPLLELAERLPAPRATRVVHGDLHVRHLLLDDGGALVGVAQFLSATLATYAHGKGIADLEHEALGGLERAVVD